MVEQFEYMYLGQWDVSLDHIKQILLTEAHIMQGTIVHDCSGGRGVSSSSTVMAAHKHTFRVKEKNILTSKGVFADHLSRIGFLSGNSDSTGCVHVCKPFNFGRMDCNMSKVFILPINFG